MRRQAADEAFALTPLRSATVFSLAFAAFSSLRLVVRKRDDLVVTEFFGPCDQGPIATHFVVLDGLRVGDNGGVQNRLVLDLPSGLVRFLDDAVDRRTLRPAGLLAELLEDLLKPFDLFVGLIEMILEARDEITVGRLVDHLRKRFEDLLFGV